MGEVCNKAKQRGRERGNLEMSWRSVQWAVGGGATFCLRVEVLALLQRPQLSSAKKTTLFTQYHPDVHWKRAWAAASMGEKKLVLNVDC